MRIVVLIAASLAFAFCSCSVAEAQNGKFPGKGSRAAWIKASEAYNRANSYVDSGKMSAALPLFEESIRLYPYDSDFYMNAAIAYGRNTKTLGQAESLIKKAIKLQPTAYDLQSQYAVILARQGRFLESRNVLRLTSKLTKTQAQSRKRDLNLQQLDKAIQKK